MSVVVPTRNEARNLEVVLPAIAAVRPAVHEVIVVDGNSVDGTIETARRVLPWVRVITQTRKGKGNAMACGFAAVTGDIVVMFDADGSADPAEIPAFVRALIAGADFAKGSRFVRGGGSDDITLLRKSGNAGLNGMANALFGTSYTDLCYGYNAFWIDILPTLDLPDIHAPAPAEGMLWGDGFEIETVLNCRVAASGLKITEVPSMERERIFGQSNLRTFADGTRVLRTLAAERRRAQQHRSEKVKLEQTSRALTPPGGFPVITPEALAADGTDVAAVLRPGGLRPAGTPFAAANSTANSTTNGTSNGGANGGTGHLGAAPPASAISPGSAGTATDSSPHGSSHGGASANGGHGTNGAAAIGQHEVPRIPVRRPGGEV
ncbi:glycosyltransferase family 2 protein [Pseudonocardia lacus]|uniref:glycosyltransferase family 2 protein n=1 Tax=Pseudonocardia lacus TaxID=2835865 RepID=UPI0027E293EA|nr:glycosyltransferase family 2 protein [Pseudonocardia lacus]